MHIYTIEDKRKSSMYMYNCPSKYYQLKKEIMRNPLEEVYILRNGEEEVVCNA